MTDLQKTLLTMTLFFAAALCAVVLWHGEYHQEPRLDAAVAAPVFLLMLLCVAWFCVCLYEIVKKGGARDD